MEKLYETPNEESPSALRCLFTDQGGGWEPETNEYAIYVYNAFVLAYTSCHNSSSVYLHVCMSVYT